MYQKVKEKNYSSAILDNGFWIFFLASLIAFGVTRTKLAGSLALSGAILLVLSQGRHEKNIFKKFISGLLSLYSTTGYLGDTLSYSRLLALGMTSAIIGMVVNILAGLTLKSFPILGFIAALLILVIGHSFNLMVSVLGAFIHSMRLQLVEFFSKFFEGGGREFKPFKRETRYVIIKS